MHKYSTKGGGSVETVKDNSTMTQQERLKQLLEYAELMHNRLKDLESVLHVMSDSVITSQELASEIMLQANTIQFDVCL